MNVISTCESKSKLWCISNSIYPDCVVFFCNNFIFWGFNHKFTSNGFIQEGLGLRKVGGGVESV